MTREGGDFVKTYEVMYIVKPMEDEATEAIITKFQDVITKNGGTIEKADRWGKKHLAYEIQDLSEGYYVLVNFKAEPAAEKELDRIMKITDEVLRHMIILKAE
jgi:small subunit ribosomal protein S6